MSGLWLGVIIFTFVDTVPLLFDFAAAEVLSISLQSTSNLTGELKRSTTELRFKFIDGCDGVRINVVLLWDLCDTDTDGLVNIC